MKMKKNYFLVLFVLLVVACNPEVYREVHLINDSSYGLELQYETMPGNERKRLSIQTGKEYLIHSFSAAAADAYLDGPLNYIELYYMDTLV